MERVAREDYARVHLALARWRLAHPDEEPPEPDGPLTLLDDELGDAVDRHPAGGDAA
jgi:hypothetical protein